MVNVIVAFVIGFVIGALGTKVFDMLFPKGIVKK